MLPSFSFAYALKDFFYYKMVLTPPSSNFGEKSIWRTFPLFIFLSSALENSPPAGKTPNSQEILPFLIICTLILHPVAELGHAANLLAVIVGHRIGVRLTGGINSVLLDTAIEIFVFLNRTVLPRPRDREVMISSM